MSVVVLQQRAAAAAPGRPGRAGWPFPAPRRVAVLRALMLGDVLCATPALRAVAAAWPDAEMTFIGLPWTRDLMARLPGVHRFLPFPGLPGLPEVQPDPAALRALLAGVRAEPFDLMLQLHGSGSIVNEFVADCRPRHAAGFVEPGGFSAEPALHTAWPLEGTEIERLLEATDHLGMPRRGMQLDYPLQAADRAALAALWPGSSTEPYVCVHAGARYASRRWPAERFAAVADALSARGLTVVLTGSAAEAPLVACLRRAMRAPSVDLVGRTDLWTLGALIERSRLLLANDTGVSHVAAALRTPSVIVSSGSDVARWAPLDPQRHRVLWEPMACRPCGHEHCPLGHGCATAIGVEPVLAAALTLLETPFDRPTDPLHGGPS